MLNLKRILDSLGLQQKALANHLELSPAAVAQIVNHNHWPKRPPQEELKQKIREFLRTNNASDEAIETAFEEWAQPSGSSTEPQDQTHKNDLEVEMLLRKQVLSPAARRHFGLVRDPFSEVRTADDVYASPDIRYVREALYQTARHGGFMAVIGESGAGKSTLRRDLIDRVTQDGQPIIVIEPYVIGMEDNDIKGKTLKAAHIAEAIMAAVAPREPVKRSPEARFRQVHQALRESSRAGNAHVLVIEEAHRIPLPTLKHLKGFFELEDGFKKLLSIVLIGQPELAQKLDERNPAVREVVQRCEVVTLQPLGEHLAPYLKQRFERMAGRPLAEILDESAIEALRAKLSGAPQRHGRPAYSVLYPLAVHNVVTAAMNMAAELGMPRVSADLVREV